MARQRQAAIWEYLRGALWVLPALSVLGALGIGGILGAISVPRHGAVHRIAFQGTADDARNLLIAIASTMVTVIALVLGLMVVALTLASTQYSPRLLRTFLRDTTNKVVLSIFVATFAYSAAALYSVGVSNGARTDNFPRLAVSGAMALLFVSLGALVFQVHHISHSIQVDEIMRRVEDATQEVIRRNVVTPSREDPPIPPAGAFVVRASRSGYLQAVDESALTEAATRFDVHLRLVNRVGEHVVSGTPIASAWTRGDGGTVVDVDGLGPAVRRAVRLGFERTLEQDAEFGIRQLVDVASKALSPAVNDPYTGVQAVDRLAVIMASIARREHGVSVHRTSTGSTVTVPGPSFADYLDTACAQIRRYGATEPLVLLALVDLLDSVAHVTDRPDRRASIATQLELVVQDADREVKQPADLAALHVAADALHRRLSLT